MKSLDFYLGLPYSPVVVPDETTTGEACYLASIAELPGCESHGRTPEEALMNLREAKELYLQSLIEDGIEPSAPQGYAVLWRTYDSEQIAFNAPTMRAMELPAGSLVTL